MIAFLGVYGAGCATGALLAGYLAGHLAPEFFVGGVALMMVCNWVSLQAIKSQHARNMTELAHMGQRLAAMREDIYRLEDMG